MGKKRKIGSWHKLNKLTKAVKITNFKSSLLFSSLAVTYLTSAIAIGYVSSSTFTELLNDNRFVEYNIDDIRKHFPVFVIDGKHVPIYDSEENLRMEFLNKEKQRIFKDFIKNSKYIRFLKYLIDPNPDNYEVEGLYKDIKTTQPIGVEDIQYNQISKNIVYMKFSVKGKPQVVPIPFALSVINTEWFLKRFFEFKMLKATQWKKVEHRNDIFYREAGFLPFQYFTASSNFTAQDTLDLYQNIRKNFEMFINNEKQEFGSKNQSTKSIMDQLKYSLQIFKGDKPLNDEFIFTKVQDANSNANIMAQQFNNKLGTTEVLNKVAGQNFAKFSVGFIPNDFNVSDFQKDASQLFTNNSASASNFEYLDVYNKYPILPFAAVYNDKVKDQTNTLTYQPNKVKWNEILNNIYANNFVINNYQLSSSFSPINNFNNLKKYLLNQILNYSTTYHNFLTNFDVNNFEQILNRNEVRFLGGITKITFLDQYHRENWTLTNADLSAYPSIINNLNNIKSITYTIGEPGLIRKTGIVDPVGQEYRDIHNYAQIFFNKAKFTVTK